MLLNKCEFGVSGVLWLTHTLQDIDTKKILYHLPLTTGLIHDYVDEVNAFVSKNITGIDGIILDCTGEAPEVARLQELIDILLAAGYTRSQILCIDSSIDFRSEFNNLILPNWIGSCKDLSNMQHIESVTDRTTLFLVLARLPKIHRVALIVKLLEHGLDECSMISCGSATVEEGLNDEVLFDRIVPRQHRYKFPILLDESRIDRHTGSSMVDDRFKKCLINVVIESGFENSHYGATGPHSHSWNRLFYTEKTDKCFYMGQLPVFLAKKGYVEMLRDVYCFDVFDDLIDHSYDNIIDPMERIDAVAQECLRLSLIGIEALASTPNLIERLEYNKKQVSIVKDRILADSLIVFTNWLKGL